MGSIRDLKNGGERNVSADELSSMQQAYAGKSEGELMSALMSKVAAAKRDGSFSAEQLDEFAAFVSPSLDESGRQRLLELIGMIKNS